VCSLANSLWEVVIDQYMLGAANRCGRQLYS
jgi:hypothetical protein